MATFDAWKPAWSTPEYWLHFAPSLHVCEARLLRRGLVPFVQDTSSSELLRQLAEDGFFELGAPEDCGLFEDSREGWGVDAAAVGAAIVALGEAGWPPLYVLVYDEVWVMRSRLGYTFRAVADLGANFDFAAFHVKAVPAGERSQSLRAGWAPHRDRDDLAHEGGAEGARSGVDPQTRVHHLSSTVSKSGRVL